MKVGSGAPHVAPIPVRLTCWEFSFSAISSLAVRVPALHGRARVKCQIDGDAAARRGDWQIETVGRNEIAPIAAWFRLVDSQS